MSAQHRYDITNEEQLRILTDRLDQIAAERRGDREETQVWRADYDRWRAKITADVALALSVTSAITNLYRILKGPRPFAVAFLTGVAFAGGEFLVRHFG